MSIKISITLSILKIIIVVIIYYCSHSEAYNITSYDPIKASYDKYKDLYHQYNRTLITTVSGSPSLHAVVASPLAQYRDDKLEYPDFFLIGAMKCGTTSLNKLLIEHPDICMGIEKEKHFFDKDIYLKGYGEYRKEFDGCPKNKFTIDSTPRYINFDIVPKRIAESYTQEDLAKKKMILILREPVSRHYSEYQMRIRLCEKMLQHLKDDDTTEKRGDRSCNRASNNWVEGMDEADVKLMSFEEWVESTDGKQEITRGHYIEHILDWLHVVKRHQVFIMNFESLIHNTPDVMTRLAKFLGLERDWGPNAQLPVPVTWARRPNTYLDCNTYDRLAKYYSVVNDRLVKFINNHPDKPKMEPYFPFFSNTRKSCQDGGNVDDDSVKTRDDGVDDQIENGPNFKNDE